MGKKGKKKKNKNRKGNDNMETGWEVKIDLLECCSKAPAEMIAEIKIAAKVKIDALMKKYPNIEWLAYLIGDKENPLCVMDLFVPKQCVTGTSVSNVVCEEFNTLSIIGVIHSHHGMGTGFSGTDHEWINQNHNLSIVVAKDGISGQFRWRTPCGGIKIVPVKCKVKYDIVFDEKSFLDIADANINTGRNNHGDVKVVGAAFGGGSMIVSKSKAYRFDAELNCMVPVDTKAAQVQYVGHGSIKDSGAKPTTTTTCIGEGQDDQDLTSNEFIDALNSVFESGA